MFLACILPLTPATAESLQISSGIDDTATYSIVDMTENDSGATVIAKRVGISGESYTKRVLNCADRTVLFLGSGNTIEDLETAKPDREATPIFRGSLAASIAEVACKIADRDAPVLASQDAMPSASAEKRP